MQHPIGTKGTFRSIKCIVRGYDGYNLLEFPENLAPSSAWDSSDGMYGNLAAQGVNLDPDAYYLWDYNDEFIASSDQDGLAWVLGVTEITRATFRGVRCLFLPNRGAQTVVEFDKDQVFDTWKGSQKEPSDPVGILSDHHYRYVTEATKELVLEVKAQHGFHCLECNNYNQHAEANLSGNRFICWGCSDSWRWKYQDHFLPNHRFYRAK